MEKKPFFIFIIMIVWILIAVFYIFRTAYLVYLFQNFNDMFNLHSIEMYSAQVFSYISNILYSLFFIVVSLILALFSFIKKGWTWIFGLMISSYLLLSNGFESINLLGVSIIGDRFNNIFGEMFYTLYFISMIALTILAIIIIVLSFNPSVKSYFGKT